MLEFLVPISEATETEVKERFKDLEFSAYEDGFLLFFRTHPEVALGQNEPLSGGQLSADIDLSRLPEWTKQTKASAFESLRARHMMTPNTTLIEVRISSDTDFEIEPIQTTLAPWKVPFISCHADLHKLYED